MSSADKSVKQGDSLKADHRTEQYVLRPKPYPGGWKLLIQKTSGHTLLQIIRRSTTPPHYLAKAFPPFEIKPFVIKALTVGEVQRYSIIANEQEALSIRQAASPQVVLLRDAQRQILARFTPISPEIILLRKDASSVGRIRFKDTPRAFGFIAFCKIIAELRWLHGIILYVIAQLEEKAATPLLETPEFEESNPDPEADAP
ncbi:MAG: hypothetical protein ACFE8O_09620 [Candidatus Hermodarchaeota archaeon]